MDRNLRFLAGLGALVLTLGPTHRARAQDLSCANAVGELQSYASQVNRVAVFESNEGIPARCGWNAVCQELGMQQLKAWYAQQAYLVNGWYAQISQACAASDGRQRPPAETRRSRDSRGISEENIQDLRIDDEDRTVRIKIPSTPQGYR
jgi:hypothetical protein